MAESTMGASGATSGVIGQALTLAEESAFFDWFQLTPYEAPRGIGAGITWHGYRPAGPRFQNPTFQNGMTLNLETDQAGMIGQITLCLDRQVIDGASTAPFAVDITRNFLNWVLSEEDRQRAGSLIDEIGDFRGSASRDSQGPVIRTPTVQLPDLSRFPGPACRTFLGYQGDFDQKLATTELRFVNLNWQRRDLNVATPPGYDAETKWFWLIVRRCS